MAETFSSVGQALYNAGYHNEATDDAIEAFRKQQRGTVNAVDMVKWCLSYIRTEPPRQVVYNAPPPNTPIDTATESRPDMPDYANSKRRQTTPAVPTDVFQSHLWRVIEKCKADPQSAPLGTHWKPGLDKLDFAGRPNISPLTTGADYR